MLISDQAHYYFLKLLISLREEKIYEFYSILPSHQSKMSEKVFQVDHQLKFCKYEIKYFV